MEPLGSRPIFIVGANRSGTTLLRLMLNAHPRIAIPEELLYFRSFFAGVPVEAWRKPNLPPPAYANLIHEFVDRVVKLHSELDGPSLTREILKDGTNDLRHPYTIVLNAWARANGKPRWGEKTPGNLFYVDIIQEMYPDAHFVYVVRDPRAGAASMQKTDFFPDDTVFNALSRRKHDHVGRRLLERYVNPDQWMIVRYEDLTSNPETTLQEICGQIEEDYDPAMLAYHRTSSTFMKEEAATTFNAAATRPVTTKRIDSWKQDLQAREVALIESICSIEMERYGYQPVTSGLPLAVLAEKWLKSAYWWLQSMRNRHIRHYTVKHPMFARLRNRLGGLTRQTAINRSS
jgi:hypothetical protein